MCRSTGSSVAIVEKARGMPSRGLHRGRGRGADEIRTHNLLDATEALSQLSYCPQIGGWRGG